MTQAILVLCLLPCLIQACGAARLQEKLDRALTDTAVVTQKDVSRDLLAVRPDNEALIWDEDRTRVLVVSWMSRDSFQRFYKGRTRTALTEDHLTWVTLAPEVRSFARAFLETRPGASRAEVDLRLKQYIGLLPQWTYDVFVEFWVAPSDLFRPCVDPEIDDTTCNLTFSTPPPQVKGIDCYPCFYKNLYFEDFRTRPRIPWTGLGYTYGWGNPVSPFGASEFILVPGAAYEIKEVTETMAYVEN